MRWVHGALLMTVLWPAVAMSQQAAPEAIPGQQGAGQAGQGTALPTPSWSFTARRNDSSSRGLWTQRR